MKGKQPYRSTMKVDSPTAKDTMKGRQFYRFTRKGRQFFRFTRKGRQFCRSTRKGWYSYMYTRKGRQSYSSRVTVRKLSFPECCPCYDIFTFHSLCVFCSLLSILFFAFCVHCSPPSPLFPNNFQKFRRPIRFFCTSSIIGERTLRRNF